MVSYRGFGQSEGVASEQGFYLDAEAMFEWALKNEQVDNETIFIFGRQLGATVAINLARKK